jgi:hypothetical protein
MLGPTKRTNGVAIVSRDLARVGRLTTAILAAGLVAALAFGCSGPSATSTATASPTEAPTPTATASASETPGGSPTPTPTAEPTLPLPHVNAALEDHLPPVIGGIELQKLSQPLSTYIAASKGGDATLYTAWMVKLGKNSDDIDIAVAADLTLQENFFIHAIQVPGATSATLVSTLKAAVTQAGWTANPMTIGKPILEIVDPTTDPSSGLGVAYAYVQADIVYFVVTDDVDLLLEALVKLP